MRQKKYLFLFLDIIQGEGSKYWLDFYFKSEKQSVLTNVDRTASNWNSESKHRHKCQLFCSSCYSLQRQTLDHDPLTTVFFGHFDSRASLHCLILTHTHRHTQQCRVQHLHHQHNIYIDAMVTKQRRERQRVHRHEERRANSSLEVDSLKMLRTFTSWCCLRAEQTEHNYIHLHFTFT